MNLTVTNAIYVQMTSLLIMRNIDLIVATHPIRNASTNAFKRKSEIAANVINHCEPNVLRVKWCSRIIRMHTVNSVADTKPMRSVWKSLNAEDWLNATFVSLLFNSKLEYLRSRTSIWSGLCDVGVPVSLFYILLLTCVLLLLYSILSDK